MNPEVPPELELVTMLSKKKKLRSVKLLILEIAWSKEQATMLNVLEDRMRLIFVISMLKNSTLESILDFPVIAFVNRMMPMTSVSGVGLLMFLLETLEMLMKPKSEIAESKMMKEGEVELGEEAFRMVMLLFEEIVAVEAIVIVVATERSWM